MVTPTPFRKEPELRNSIPSAEWQARVDLAAAYRYAQYAGWNDGIYNHITLRVPGEPDHFLLKPHELLFEEVTASSLLKLDMEGRLLGEDKPINPAATTIHTAVLVARPDIDAVMHVHTEVGIAISALKGGLKFFCQDAMNFYDRIGYHDFEGIATDSEECARLARDLGAKNHTVILRNHGLLTTGTNISRAVTSMAMLIRVADAQLRLMAAGAEIVEPSREVCAHTAEQFNKPRPGNGAAEWAAILRKLDGIDPSFRE
ncbi:MAG TPA: class II aldolase/adducin family protein [Stellaceae bacterium]|nr:class II aldolase/adducin family protein [Stellaceae bacterium]